MASTVGSILRLSRAGIVLAQYGVEFVPEGTKPPLALHLARAATLPVRILTWPFRAGRPKAARVAGALTSLGPSYIKLGQFLATRADLIGPELAGDLRHLQDRLPPFSMAEARNAIEDQLGGSRITSPSSGLPSPQPPSPRCTRRSRSTTAAAATLR
jgi:ubiquinone biosynthesis protein